MSTDNINLNKGITTSFSTTPAPAHEVESTPTDSKVEHARAESLQTPKPDSRPNTFQAKQFSTDMYHNNLLERVCLSAFLRNTAFGSQSQLSQEMEAREFKDLLEPRSILGSDLSSQKVIISLSDKQSITAYRMERKRSDDDPNKKTDRPVALIITGSFGPAGAYAAPLARAYLDQGYDVLVVDPVGFGASQKAGKPTPENFMKSAEAGAQYVQKHMQTKNDKVIVHGYSMGGFAAAHVAGLKENEGMHVVLDRTAASSGLIAQSEISKTAGKVVGKLAGKITQEVIPYDLKETLPKLKGRVLVVQADSKGGMEEAARLVQNMKPKLSPKVEDPVWEGGKHITEFSKTWTQKYGPSEKKWKAFVVQIKAS